MRTQACPLELHGSFSIQATSCDLELNQYGEWAKDGGGLRIANVTGGGKLSMKDICELTLHRIAAWNWQLDSMLGRLGLGLLGSNL